MIEDCRYRGGYQNEQVQVKIVIQKCNLNCNLLRLNPQDRKVRLEGKSEMLLWNLNMMRKSSQSATAAAAALLIAL